MKFTIDSRISEIRDYFEPDSEMLLSATPTWFNEGNLAMTPKNIQACCPPWNAINIVYGLNHLACEKESGRAKGTAL